MKDKEVNKVLYDIYCGILLSSHMAIGNETVTSYDFSSEGLKKLKAIYPIEKIAKSGGDFARAYSICKWLKRLFSVHKSDFSLTEEVKMNSISLLDYAVKGGGLNCVAKSKILIECCLSIGIFARMVGMYPCSPYDVDNHVVAEIYDKRLDK